MMTLSIYLRAIQSQFHYFIIINIFLIFLIQSESIQATAGFLISVHQWICTFFTLFRDLSWIYLLFFHKFSNLIKYV